MSTDIKNEKSDPICWQPLAQGVVWLSCPAQSEQGWPFFHRFDDSV
jgi:hypothetical protein